MAEEVKYLGLNKLDTFEIDQLRTLTERTYPKIMRALNKHQQVNLNARMTVNVKKVNAEGKQKNYLIKANVKSTAGNFDVEQSDWDLARTLHKVFNNLQNLIRKELKLK